MFNSSDLYAMIIRLIIFNNARAHKLSFQLSGPFYLSGHLEICCDQRGLDNRGSTVL